ncbi:MAG: hypothetical protein LBU32_27990 [Clostridiales bacterium]|jgi:hypothetical protein|nr:hypothetical protein [Clostridiales bacterium]
MAASTASKIVVRERKITFEIAAQKSGMPAKESGYGAFQSMRRAARESGVQDWPLEEINNEISAAVKSPAYEDKSPFP